MKQTTEELARVLKLGIKTEIDGQIFYSGLAQQVVYLDARKKLERLAADEAIHEKRLRALYSAHIGGDATDLPEHGLAVLKQAFGDKPLAEADKFKLLDMAIDAELRTARFYRAEEEKSVNAEIRAVFAELVVEEDGHYNLLMAERESLRGNISWFSFGDSAMMEE